MQHWSEQIVFASRSRRNLQNLDNSNLELYHKTMTNTASMLEMCKTRPPAYETVLGIIYVNWQSQDDNHFQ